jgi:hypothetical protein
MVLQTIQTHFPQVSSLDMSVMCSVSLIKLCNGGFENLNYSKFVKYLFCNIVILCFF